ncbi:ATP-dependent 6-phosphofructokinase 5, chloroplastic-like isoform X3 [Canna indica]|uniref:ATP-dependent 6-phosphofructokinase 5, chloroplastic-like isoform X3 n=1 Tax=Canna indica TaxID=4628 RepID=A0AAQ3KKQ3_9LILI|nr:ATP-dependent 6-phosphofructokinase 5, chloroplastic-like isoform X3 [Canna indica]
MAFAAPSSGVDLVNVRQHGIRLHASYGIANSSYVRMRMIKRVIRAQSEITSSEPPAMKQEIDFSDPDWKKHYQEDFDRRFNLPHLMDILDIKPRPTTFSLKSRIPLGDDNGTASDMWNGYVNDDDRALLKVLSNKCI